MSGIPRVITLSIRRQRQMGIRDMGYADPRSMRLREIFGTNLRRLRHASGLSQEELAHRAGINRNYVGLLERAANSPTLDTIERLAEELAVDPVRFFEKPGGR